MARKIVQTGSSLAVTLPKDIVDQLGLKRGDEVEVALNPKDHVIIIRPGIRYAEGGKVSKRFKDAAAEVMKRYDKAFAELSK